MLSRSPIHAAAGQRSGVPETDLLPCRVQDLVLRIGAKTLLDHVSFTLEAEQLTVVMGPNGAGKSLLMRTLHGLLEPTRGSVTWGRSETSRIPRKRQAMVFQRPVLLRRTVAANVRFAQRTRQAEDCGIIKRLLDATQLSGQADQPARKLSGGEQQRLALARALATGPDVLFLDEATASLDPTSTRIIEDLVLATHRKGTKIIFVTHDIGQARRLADDIVFLASGKLCEHRPAKDFFSAPQSPQADAYLNGRILD